VLTNRTSEEYLNGLRYLDFNKEPRYKAEYNNWGFLIAGEASARAAGMPWADLIQQRILNKLGMNETYPLLSSVPESAQSRMALPYSDSGHPEARLMRMSADPVAPAGSIVSNAVDMQKWMGSWIKQWQGQTPVLSQKSWKDFTTPVMEFGFLNPLLGGYALGTILEQIRCVALRSLLVSSCYSSTRF
jgi:CubicO group peptidase (beta-lactamase class C family)